MTLRSITLTLLLVLSCNLAAADFSTPMGGAKDTTDRVIAIQLMNFFMLTNCRLKAIKNT